MLSMAQVRAHLARISYKPGWTLTAYEGRHEGHHAVIRAELPDAYHPGRTVVLDVHSPLPPMRDTAALEEWLSWRLARIETHEAREFLRRDGQVIFDPHGPDANHDKEPG